MEFSFDHWQQKRKIEDFLVDEGLNAKDFNIDMLVEAGFMKKIALAGALGAGAMGMMGGSNGSDINQDKSDQVQNVVQNDNGVTTNSDGSIVSIMVHSNHMAAKAMAMNNLAKYMGTNRLPPGIESRIIKDNGKFKAVLTYSKDSEQRARDVSMKMGNNSIVQSDFSPKKVSTKVKPFKNGYVTNPSDL